MDSAAIGKRDKKESRRQTWLAVKQNKECYLMMLPDIYNCTGCYVCPYGLYGF